MQSQKLDIVELIETNPITKLSKNYQGKFLEKIQNPKYIYIYLTEALPELLQKYDTTIFQYVPRSAIKIKCINPETKEEQIFPSLKHARDFTKVHHKTVSKAINEKKLLNGFYWEIVN